MRNRFRRGMRSGHIGLADASTNCSIHRLLKGNAKLPRALFQQSGEIIVKCQSRAHSGIVSVSDAEVKTSTSSMSALQNLEPASGPPSNRYGVVSPQLPEPGDADQIIRSSVVRRRRSCRHRSRVPHRSCSWARRKPGTGRHWRYPALADPAERDPRFGHFVRRFTRSLTITMRCARRSRISQTGPCPVIVAACPTHRASSEASQPG